MQSHRIINWQSQFRQLEQERDLGKAHEKIQNLFNSIKQDLTITTNRLMPSENELKAAQTFLKKLQTELESLSGGERLRDEISSYVQTKFSTPGLDNFTKSLSSLPDDILQTELPAFFGPKETLSLAQTDKHLNELGQTAKTVQVKARLQEAFSRFDIEERLEGIPASDKEKLVAQIERIKSYLTSKKIQTGEINMTRLEVNFLWNILQCTKDNAEITGEGHDHFFIAALRIFNTIPEEEKNLFFENISPTNFLNSLLISCLRRDKTGISDWELLDRVKTLSNTPPEEIRELSSLLSSRFSLIYAVQFLDIYLLLKIPQDKRVEAYNSFFEDYVSQHPEYPTGGPAAIPFIEAHFIEVAKNLSEEIS